jgi:hypothetical protein
MNTVTSSETQTAVAANTETAAKKLSLVAKELPFEMLLKLDVGTVDDLARQYMKKGEKVKETRDDYKDATKAFGKIACALEIRLENGKKQNFYPANKSLAEFIKDIAGEKPPTHALTLKNAFGAYVETQLIAETDYDANSNNCLELAARIVDAVKGNLTHDAVLKAAQELKDRTDKEAKNLRDILASVKPPKKLDAKEALDLFQQICDDGHLVACLAQLPDVFGELPETELRDTYVAFARALERIDTEHGDVVDAWTREEAERNKGIKITAAGAEVGRVTPETEPAAVAA